MNALQLPGSLQGIESKSKMIAANGITLRMDVTSSVNPRCRDKSTNAGSFAPRQRNKRSSLGCPSCGNWSDLSWAGLWLSQQGDCGGAERTAPDGDSGAASVPPLLLPADSPPSHRRSACSFSAFNDTPPPPRSRSLSRQRDELLQEKHPQSVWREVNALSRGARQKQSRKRDEPPIKKTPNCLFFTPCPVLVSHHMEHAQWRTLHLLKHDVKFPI